MALVDLAESLSFNKTAAYGPKVSDVYPSFLLKFHHMALVIVIYLLVIGFGPKLMRGRRACDLRRIVMVYNLVQVAINAYVLYLTCSEWGFRLFGVWKHICEPIGGTAGYSEPNQLIFVKVIYIYYLTKILDLFDTVFFILRKKQSQITFLHLFHHSSMVVNMWFSMDLIREQIISVFGLVNVTVHVVMYTYYLLAAMGPRVQKYLWWKKYITKLQLAQFVIFLALLAKMRIYNCKSKVFFWPVWSFTILVYFILFINFYVTAYKNTTKNLSQKMKM
ncbi:very long chain fatty acid elongase AAEL008004 [Halyomorpha halys]|uniref:very long chain fatty acid elongase AAEL008004 n=1 Tax=Halyomorpha halys TaxID=286706 RepID=UPI0006D4CA7C|nr:elongation of very long chain fatty acids protein AAEL008004-like [Halyomorpha halys]